MIREIENGKLYIGESAGAIVVALDIGYSAAMDRVEKAPELSDYSGLSLVEFYTVPHLGNWELGKAARIIVDQYASSLNLTVINRKQAVFVEGDTIKILDKRTRNKRLSEKITRSRS